MKIGLIELYISVLIHLPCWCCLIDLWFNSAISLWVHVPCSLIVFSMSLCPFISLPTRFIVHIFLYSDQVKYKHKISLVQSVSTILNKFYISKVKVKWISLCKFLVQRIVSFPSSKLCLNSAVKYVFVCRGCAMTLS